MSSKQNCSVCLAGLISLSGLSIFALTKLAIYIFSKKPLPIPEEYKSLDFLEEELTLQNFENVLKQHTIRFNETNIMEEILPREFINESQLKKISDNFIYAQGNQDLLSLTKVCKKKYF